MTEVGHDRLVGLDIGTSKCVAVVGERDEAGTLEILGRGYRDSDNALNKGTVVNIEVANSIIKSVLDEAGFESGSDIHSVYVSISGEHIFSENKQGMVTLKTRRVEKEDIVRILGNAATANYGSDRRILHNLPQNYSVDTQTNIKQPLKMAGARLEVNSHIITGSKNAQKDIKRCIPKDIQVESFVLSHLACAAAVLNEDQRELGVCLVDIGGGTTDISIYHQGSLIYTKVLGLSGGYVTRDIAKACETSLQNAERIKLEYGAISPDLVSATEIPVDHIDSESPKIISSEFLCEVICARYQQILEEIYKELQSLRLDINLGGGFVLTGGASKVPGLLKFTEELFQCSVTIGKPEGFLGGEDIFDNDPSYSVAAGLLRYGYKERDNDLNFIEPKNWFFGLFLRIKNWIIREL